MNTFSVQLNNMQLIRDMPSGSLAVHISVSGVPESQHPLVLDRLKAAQAHSFVHSKYHLFPIYHAIAAYKGLRLVVVDSEAKDNEVINIPLLFESGLRTMVGPEFQDHITVTEVVNTDVNGYKTVWYPNRQLPPSVDPQHDSATG
jgi:hypothetical protein